MAITSSFRLPTQRLFLRPLTLNDLPLLHADIMGDAEVMRFIGNGAISNLHEAETFLCMVIERYTESDLGWFAMTSKYGVDAYDAAAKELLGVSCLKPVRGELREAFGEHVEVGYWLAKAAWGRGYATEAARALVRYGFETLGLSEIIGMVDARNAASARVLQKTGLKYDRSAMVREIKVDCYLIKNGANS